MNDAQMEIKSTVTVNTTEIAARANEDNKDSKELEKNGNKKRARELTIFLPKYKNYKKNYLLLPYLTLTLVLR